MADEARHPAKKKRAMNLSPTLHRIEFDRFLRCTSIEFRNRSTEDRDRFARCRWRWYRRGFALLLHRGISIFRDILILALVFVVFICGSSDTSHWTFVAFDQLFTINLKYRGNNSQWQREIRAKPCLDQPICMFFHWDRNKNLAEEMIIDNTTTIRLSIDFEIWPRVSISLRAAVFSVTFTATVNIAMTLLSRSSVHCVREKINTASSMDIWYLWLSVLAGVHVSQISSET